MELALCTGENVWEQKPQMFGVFEQELEECLLLIWYLQNAHCRVRSVRVGVGEKLLAEKGQRTAGIPR